MEIGGVPREEFLYALVQSYAGAEYDNRVWLRVSSSESIFAKGKLMGALTVLELDFEETKDQIKILTRKQRKEVVVYEKITL